MDRRESAIICAYTGVSFGGRLFSDFHQYVEEKFQRPVFTHEMGDRKFWNRLKKLSRDDFLNLAVNIA